MNKGWDDEFFREIDAERQIKKDNSFFDSHSKFAHLSDIAASVALDLEKLGGRFYCEEDFNFYSNAYLIENVMAFAAVIESVGKKFSQIKYLEVGVNKGMSSLAVHLLARKMNFEYKIIGVDPYFEDGYVEGVKRNINKTTRDKALRFLGENGVKFELVEKTSSAAFIDFIRSQSLFNCIYIDGCHEKLFPLIDIGSYVNLLERNGIFMIDDYFWRDVFQVKHLFDRYAERLCESWKIAAYKIHPENPIF